MSIVTPANRVAPAHRETQRDEARQKGGGTNPGRRLRVIAATLGLLSAVLSLGTPLLPVHQDMVTVSWPTGRDTSPVTAPLVTYQPLALRIAVPCTAVSDLDARTEGPARLVSTMPAGSMRSTGMTLQVDNGRVAVINGGRQLASAPLPSSAPASAVLISTAQPSGDCLLRVSSDSTGTDATLAGTSLVDLSGDLRPEVVGVYSDLDSERDRIDGLSVELQVDTRYQSTAHRLKIATMVVALLTLLGSMVALHLLDVRTGRSRSLRWVPRGWWRLTARDAVVLGVLAVWMVIGTITVDDGYLLTMARVREETGYLGNYYRWFNAPESPFGWPTELYALMSQVSTSTLWMRLPALAMGVLAWGLLSREVLPRLGVQVRRSPAAAWAAAGVFLCFWLPFNNGMRPEPAVALGSLITLCAVERAIATRRLLPAGLGLLVAGLTVAVTPTGLIAAVPFLVAARPLLALLRDRAGVNRAGVNQSGVNRSGVNQSGVKDPGVTSEPEAGLPATGWLPVLAPLLAAGLLTLVVAFADQSFAAVMEAIRVRTAIGPNLSWYEEPERYWQLLGTNGSSVTRQFPVLVLLLCVVTCIAVSLRRGGIPGAALGPSQRLIATVVGSLAVLALTPTKWTHHFGAFAALGAVIAALTTLATGGEVLRSRRNRAAFVAALLAITALATTGSNSWHYVSSLGVPWFDKPPSIRGFHASTALLVAAGLALLVAVVEHLRPERAVANATRPRHRRSRPRLATSAPLVLVCVGLAIAEVAAMGKAMVEQRGSYSVGASNVAQVTDGDCGLSDAVLVEPDPRSGILSPPGNATTADARGAFHREVPRPATEVSEWSIPPPLPYGLGSDDAPVWSSHQPEGTTTGTLHTGWYPLPAGATEGQVPIVVSVAGWFGPDRNLTAEFRTGTTSTDPASGGGNAGQSSDDQVTAVPLTDAAAPAGSSAPGWRDLRVGPLGDISPGATAMRLVAHDEDDADDVPAAGRVSTGWLAFSAPRVPNLVPMTELIGRDQPVLLEWPVAFVFPCLRPSGVRDGIAELPRYWIASPAALQPASQEWSAGHNGGPIGWLSAVATAEPVPSYFRGNWQQDWGRLMRVRPTEPDTHTAPMQRARETRWGWWSPGPIAVPETESRPQLR